MTLALVAFIAGVLTVLAPCILPLLPIIIGSSVGARSKSTPYVVIGSLALSILLFTYLLKASTVLIAIPQSVWGYVSGGIVALIGLALVFPRLWERLPFLARTSAGANKLVGTGHQKNSVWGDVLVGAALGPVFSSCSPTYFVILAVVLPTSFALGTLYLLTYIAGLVLVLGLIALSGQRLLGRLQVAADTHGWFKRAIGVLFIVVGLFIATGLDKKLETWVLDRGYLGGVLEVEQRLLEQARTTEGTTPRPPQPEIAEEVELPSALLRSFPGIDPLNADPRLAAAVSGGPPKDGIPALDAPVFEPLSDNDRPDDVQALVLVGNDEVKVYPYNVLTWHEIVNDTIDGTPIAVTFCPLCGSALVFDRTLSDGRVSTFGVSGLLLESNMIMYDRTTESLWQQSTGRTLAGTLHPSELARVSFQLLSLGEVRALYPEARVLSEETGYDREYGRNPYAGYEGTDDFIFAPSSIDTTLPQKTIMLVFTDSNTTFAVPWLPLREAGRVSTMHAGRTYEITATDSGEIMVRDHEGVDYSFYFEMWFSVAVQHGDGLILVLP